MTTEKEQKTSTESKGEAAEAAPAKAMCHQMAEHCGPMMAKMIAACGAKTAEDDAASSEKEDQSCCC